MKHANRVQHMRTPTKRVAFKLPFSIAAYFVWVVPALRLPSALSEMGAPYLLITYEYQERGGERFYLACTYAGPSGVRSIRPADGTCPLVKLMAGTI